MAFSNKRVALLLAGMLLAATACGGNGAVPSNGSTAANPLSRVSDSNIVSPEDNTSILKGLKKDVVIGTTVDPTNGDKAAHGLTIVKADDVLKKGQLIVCNFENESGTAGDGTTIDIFNPTAGSKPTTFTQSSDIEGCAGVAASSVDDVFGAGLTKGEIGWFTQKGKLYKAYGSPLKAPFSEVDASNPNLYSAEYIFSSDAQTGSIVSFSVNNYGNPKAIQVATGFAVNKQSGWSTLGPSGLQYNRTKDTLYIADGPDNTIVAFTGASNLLETDEIVVKAGGKTFTCKHKADTCGKLVLAGSPLNDPEAMTILPNGNLIVANTAGSSVNTLVELTPSGTVLDTKVVDTSKTPGIFGLAATGTTDANTVLFFTDTNSNNLQELEP
jgi:hypothetical protein